MTVLMLLAFTVPAQASVLASSILPGSRSVQTGTPATAFATIINAGDEIARDCLIAPRTNIPAPFFFQTTEAATNALTGDPDTLVDIPAGAAQSFVIGFTPDAPFSSTDVTFTFDCANTNPALAIPGVNTLLLSAATELPPDIIALSATLTGDGIANIPNASGTGVFSVATVNTGSSSEIRVSVDSGNANLPVVLSLCETDPAIGACINPAVPTTGEVITSIDADATPTFAFFVTGQGDVGLDPALNRIFVRFKDAGGATSVAVQTALAALDYNQVVEQGLALFGGDFVTASMALLQAYDKGYSPGR